MCDYGTFSNAGVPATSICPQCGKPYMYIGDIVGNVEDYICTCYSKGIGWSQGVYTPINKGWECPRCGKIYAPHVTECFYCNNKTPKSNGWGTPDFTDGIRIKWQY